eukprot:543382-Amorphochlora_amoeboformis.AAC.2
MSRRPPRRRRNPNAYISCEAQAYLINIRTDLVRGSDFPDLLVVRRARASESYNDAIMSHDR